MAKLNVNPDLLDQFCRTIEDDYDRWGAKSIPTLGANARQMQLRAEDRMERNRKCKVHYEVGSTYIKIVTEIHGSRSVHSFVVNKDVKGFTVGQVLKAASWKAPALNWARGNINSLTPGIVNWTGAS
jgi:hypothetical protein